MAFLAIPILLGYVFHIARYFKWPIEFAWFFVIGCSITVNYIAAYCGYLYIVTTIVMVVGSLSFLSLPWLLCKEKEAKKRYLTPAFTSFLILGGLCSLLAYHARLHGWDEFTHWAPHALSVAYHHGFYPATEFFDHPGYPLGNDLFYYLFYRVSDGYSEGATFLAQQILILAPLMLMFRGFGAHSKYTTFSLVSLFLLTLKWSGFHLATSISLYMDNPTAVYFGMMVVAYFSLERTTKTIYALIPIAMSFVLLRPSVLGFVVVVVAIMFFDQCLYYYSRTGKYLNLSCCKPFLACISLLVSAWATVTSWNFHLSQLNIPLDMGLSSSLFEKVKETFIYPSAQTLSTMWHYLQAAIKPVLMVTLLFASSLLILYRWIDRECFIRLLLRNSLLYLGFLGFLAALFFSYLYGFTAYEREQLASFDRYVNQYVYACYFIVATDLIMLIRIKMNNKIERLSKRFSIFLVLILIILLGYREYHLTRPQVMQESEEFLRMSIDSITDKVRKKVKENERVLVVWQGSWGSETIIVRYNLYPRKVFTGSFGKPYIPSDIWTRNFNKEQFLQQMFEVDYILLAYPDKQFWQAYGDLFPQRNKPLLDYSVCRIPGFNGIKKKGCEVEQVSAYLFKVNKHNAGVQLENVAE